MGINDSQNFKGDIKFARPKEGVEHGTPVTEMADPEVSRSKISTLSLVNTKTRAQDYGTTIPGAFNYLQKHKKFPDGIQERYKAWRERPMTNDAFKVNFMDELYKYVRNAHTTMSHFNNLLNQAFTSDDASNYQLAA